MDISYEAIFCIVNSGFAEAAMDAARKAGADGGTILKGHGSAGHEAELKFNIQIQPEKELLIILIPEENRDRVLRALYDGAGLDSAGQGIIFSLPVEKTAGLSVFHKEPEAQTDPDKE